MQVREQKTKVTHDGKRVKFVTVKPVLNGHSQKDQIWFSRPIIA